MFLPLLISVSAGVGGQEMMKSDDMDIDEKKKPFRAPSRTWWDPRRQPHAPARKKLDPPVP